MKNLKKSTNKFIENKKFNIMMKKEILNSNFDLSTNFFQEICSITTNQCTIEFSLYFSSSLFNNSKKPTLKTNHPKFMILNVDFSLKFSNYTSRKRFICLKLILKNLFTTLHTQFNNLAQPVCPFKA